MCQRYTLSSTVVLNLFKPTGLKREKGEETETQGEEEEEEDKKEKEEEYMEGKEGALSVSNSGSVMTSETATTRPKASFLRLLYMCTDFC